MFLIAEPGLSNALTAGSEVMPVANLETQQPTTVWRGATTDYVVADLGSAQAINFIGLLYANATADATVRVRAAATEGDLTADPAYDSGTIPYWCHMTATGQSTLGYTRGLMLHLPATAQTYQWWRIDVADAGNPDGYFQAGRLYISNAFIPTKSVRYGPSIFPPINGRRSIEAAFRWDNQADAWDQFYRITRVTASRGLQSIGESSGGHIYPRATGDVFVMLDTTTKARLMDWSLYGIMRDVRPITIPNKNIYGGDFRIEELI